MRKLIVALSAALLAATAFTTHTSAEASRPALKYEPTAQRAAVRDAAFFAQQRHLTHLASLKHIHDALVHAQQAKATAIAKHLGATPAEMIASHAWAQLPGTKRVVQCESGGVVANKGNPSYRGKYQMGFAEWRTFGGYGDPADASEAEQDLRAWRYWSQSGWHPWDCGWHAG